VGAYIERSLKLRLLVIAAERKKSLTAVLAEIIEAEVSSSERRRVEDASLGKSFRSNSPFPHAAEEIIVLEDKPTPKKKTGT
jgi:hypothetical protein